MSKCLVGSNTGGIDNIRGIKLRIQDDYGIPINSINAFRAESHIKLQNRFFEKPVQNSIWSEHPPNISER